MKKMYYLLLFIIVTNVYPASFFIGPNPSKFEYGGTAFAIQNDPGRYNITISIYDATQNLMFKSEINNFVISNASIKYPIEAWNYINYLYKVVAYGTYKVYVKSVNAVTGAVFETNQLFGNKPDANYPPSIINASSGDKIIQSKFSSSSKAIILLEGNDAMNQYSGYSLEAKYRLIGNIPGYDFYIVDWKDAGLSIFTNAQNTVSIIQQLVNTYKYSEIVLIGKSLGGVVGRLALAKAETDGLKLPVKKFISLDAPQQGVQINLTAQAAVYSVCSSCPDWLVPFNGGLVTANNYKSAFLERPSSRETQYYHIGLAESYVRNSSCILDINDCALNTSNLDAIKNLTTKWHDDFYLSLKKYGNIYGYPKDCKNYAIAYSNGKLLYSNKTPNQYIADFSSLKYHIYSDIYDINQGSYAYNPAVADQLVMRDGFSAKTILVPLESALDLHFMDYAKTNGVFNRDLTYEELSLKSPFDKIYIKENRVDHMTAMDGELLSFITDAINDNTPKQNKILPPDFLPIILSILN
jgi:hypothetical protein